MISTAPLYRHDAGAEYLDRVGTVDRVDRVDRVGRCHNIRHFPRLGPVSRLRVDTVGTTNQQWRTSHRATWWGEVRLIRRVRWYCQTMAKWFLGSPSPIIIAYLHLPPRADRSCVTLPLLRVTRDTWHGPFIPTRVTVRLQSGYSTQCRHKSGLSFTEDSPPVPQGIFNLGPVWCLVTAFRYIQITAAAAGTVHHLTGCIHRLYNLRLQFKRLKIY